MADQAALGLTPQAQPLASYIPGSPQKMGENSRQRFGILPDELVSPCLAYISPGFDAQHSVNQV